MGGVQPSSPLPWVGGWRRGEYTPASYPGNYFQKTVKSIKNVNKIYFDLEKNIDNGEVSISNIYLNKIDTENFSDNEELAISLQELTIPPYIFLCVLSALVARERTKAQSISRR